MYTILVFGFLQDTFTGVEQPQRHLVQVGYQKGANIIRQNFQFNVGHTAGTAREYACVVKIANLWVPRQ